MLFLNLQPQVGGKREYFKYEAKWQLEENYNETIDEGWTEGVNGGSRRSMLQGLSACRKKLKIWSKQLRGDPRKALKGLKGKLAVAEINATLPWEDMKVLRKEISDLLKKEKKIWGQRSRIRWLKFRNKILSIRWCNRERSIIERLD